MKYTLIAIFGFGILACSPGAQAETITAQCASSSIVGGDKTSCAAYKIYAFSSEGPGIRHYVRLRAPRTHCSDVMYTISSGDGARFLGHTEFLQPGRTQAVEVGDNLEAGDQVVQIRATGKIGGCNTGVMQSWAVEITSGIVH